MDHCLSQEACSCWSNFHPFINPKIHYCVHKDYHRTVSLVTCICSNPSHYVTPKATEIFCESCFVSIITNGNFSPEESCSHYIQPCTSKSNVKHWQLLNKVRICLSQPFKYEMLGEKENFVKADIVMLNWTNEDI